MSTPIVQWWVTAPEMRRVSLAARALWLLMAVQHKRLQMPAIRELSGLDGAQTSALVAELMTAQLLELHGHVCLEPSFSVLPRPDLSLPLTTPVGIDWLDNRTPPPAVH